MFNGIEVNINKTVMVLEKIRPLEGCRHAFCFMTFHPENRLETVFAAAYRSQNFTYYVINMIDIEVLLKRRKEKEC